MLSRSDAGHRVNSSRPKGVLAELAKSERDAQKKKRVDSKKIGIWM